MNQNTTYDGRTAFENAQVGDVIRVPQYEGALKVVSDGREVGRLGLEFVEDGRGSALKSLVQNENSGNVYLTAGTSDKGQVEEVEFVAPVEREDEGDEDDDEDEETTLDDLEQGDEIEVRYTTSHGNETTLSGRVRSLSESTFTDQTNEAVLWDADDDRTYRLHGTRKVTVSSLRSGSPVQVGHSGTLSVEDDDEEDEPADADDESPTFTLDLPDYGNVADYADSVDLSELSEDELERLDDRVTDMLNGDPFAFPSDEALQSASDLSAAIRDEFQDRDPRRDDPYFTPHDSEDRYSLDLSAVEVEHAPATTYVRLTFSDGSEWTTRPGLDIANLVRDYLDLDDLRAIGTCVGQSLPVVGDETGEGWVRLDRYALEHDGTTALDDENADPEPEAVRTDGGYRGATDDDVRTAVENAEDDDPTLVTDGGVPVENEDDDEDDAELIQVRGEHDGVATLSVYYRVGPTTFRARLRPVRPLPEEDHIRDREALVLSDLCSLDVSDLDGFAFVGPDAPTEEWFDTTHVPPVVRRAVDRPVQVPDLGNVEGDPDGR